MSFAFVNAAVILICCLNSCSSATSLFRHKRQLEVSQSNQSPEELFEALKSFVPAWTSKCPKNYLTCRDGSFCFTHAHLCNSTHACRDGSDDINAICLGTTTAITTTNAITSTEKPQTTISAAQDNVGNATTFFPAEETKATPEVDHSFGDPLVISFIVLVCGLLVYVALATYCCATNHWNVINPGTSTA